MAKAHETLIKVRFNEVDSYHVAWHGHYVAWMEVGRNDLAARFQLGVDQIADAGFLAPVVELNVKYKRSARFDEELRVRTGMIRTEASTLMFSSEIIGEDGQVKASGTTVHVLTDKNGVLQYSLPPVIAERLEKMMAFLGV
ncbi:acyl-CoA thioesterase [Geotalea sp. SG265]|uniref:acyl-CoA thioesterase n=1 Tax=Geotalea sp. SG265 TaxID=2922867 RepID=UPI001FAF4C8E|nr:acyl-CoA thioesterase [Geotalea sp. SG265]